VLIIHLKRFLYVQGRFRQKINTFVEFPLTALNMGPYLVDPPPTPLLYDLYAVINHRGSISGGHYTAFIRSDDKWYCCDDSRVYPARAESVVTAAAYVLFYRRRVEEKK